MSLIAPKCKPCKKQGYKIKMKSHTDIVYPKGIERRVTVWVCPKCGHTKQTNF